jgi:hypothetical protein
VAVYVLLAWPEQNCLHFCEAKVRPAAAPPGVTPLFIGLQAVSFLIVRLPNTQTFQCSSKERSGKAKKYTNTKQGVHGGKYFPNIGMRRNITVPNGSEGHDAKVYGVYSRKALDVMVKNNTNNHA